LYDYLVFFFFKQKTAYEMRISDWSSDVCSSDLNGSAMQFDTRTMNLALKIIDGVTAERGRSPFAALAQGIMPTSLPDLGYDEAVRVAELGSELLKRADAEIGRASCRERVCQYVKCSVVADSLKKKQKKKK